MRCQVLSTVVTLCVVGSRSGRGGAGRGGADGGLVGMGVSYGTSHAREVWYAVCVVVFPGPFCSLISPSSSDLYSLFPWGCGPFTARSE